MKLRARKGEGAVSPQEMAEQRERPDLPNGRRRRAAGACAGAVEEAGAERIRELCEIFGRENIYVELQRHFCRDEEARNQAAIEISARELNLPLLATNGVCHATPQQREVLDVFTCIRNHRTLSSAGRLLARNSERHLKSPAEMARLFADLPEAIANTEILSSRLEFRLKRFGLRISEVSRAGRQAANGVSSRAHL